MKNLWYAYMVEYLKKKPKREWNLDISDKMDEASEHWLNKITQAKQDEHHITSFICEV